MGAEGAFNESESVFSGVLERRWEAFVHVRSRSRHVLREVLERRGAVREVRLPELSRSPDLTIETVEGDRVLCRGLRGVALPNRGAGVNRGPISQPKVDAGGQNVTSVFELSRMFRSERFETSWSSLLSLSEDIFRSALLELSDRYAEQLQLLSAPLEPIRRMVDERFAVITAAEMQEILLARRAIQADGTSIVRQQQARSSALSPADIREIVAHFGNTPTIVVAETRLAAAVSLAAVNGQDVLEPATQLVNSGKSSESRKLASALILFPKVGAVATVGLVSLVSPSETWSASGGVALSFERFLGILLQSNLF